MNKSIHIAPLANFRIIFGLMMLVSIVRYVARGWVYDQLIQPGFHFKFYGFSWVEPLGATGMYTVYAFMGLAALGICLGAFYRLSAPLFFLLFTYTELIDSSNYLNHYYFVSLVALLLIFVPANRYNSIDNLIWPKKKRLNVPLWMIGIFRIQLGIVYVYAGMAKINSDWLFRAMPMKIWLPAKANLWLVGGLLKMKWVAYAFSWIGCIYDLSVPFLLIWKKTRPFAYLAVIVFHLATWLLFPIGMFPFIMILSTLIFFPAEFHLKAEQKIRSWLKLNKKHTDIESSYPKPTLKGRVLAFSIALLMVFQVLFPFRYLLYPGSLFWTEQGYRFSWRVMLMEKAGSAFFYVTDPESGGRSEIDNRAFLSPNQEKMMATQPDMILQFAHYLAKIYQERGIQNPEVRAEVYVTLNGSGSRPYIDSDLDLALVEDGWGNKNWILPFKP